MSSTHLAVSAVLVSLLAVPLAGQCGGNSANADLRTTPFVIGAPLDVTVSGGPGESYTVYLSNADANLAIPGLGTVCLSVTDPSFRSVITGTLPAAGTETTSIPIPNNPALLGFVAYAQGHVTDAAFPGGNGLTQAYRVDFEAPDSYVSMPTLSTARVLATGDLLPDGRVLVVGGGAGSFLGPLPTDTCDIFDPFSRTMTPGPLLPGPRAFHASATLGDGRVLICGGVDDLIGNVTASCLVFDPATQAWGAAAPMSTARSAHTATVLDDGRVLVTGGTNNFTGTFGQILNASANTGEVYDPVTDSWSVVPNTMTTRRFQPAATLLADGRVLITGGISGATSFFGIEIPTLTSSSNFYDPVSNTFSSAPSVPTGVVGHRMTRMPNGSVVLAGGARSVPLGSPTATAGTALFTGTGWTAGPNLPAAVAMHAQVLLQNGELHVMGGLTGDLLVTSATANAVRFDGATLTPRNPLPDPRGLAVGVLLESGMILLAGGADAGAVAVDSCALYTPE